MNFCDSVQGWRHRWFYLKDSKQPGQQFGLAPFNPNALVVKRKSWRRELSAEEMAATDGLVAKVAELEANKSFTGLHLAALFIRRRVQPLQARVAPMWSYLGPSDPSRTRAEELSNDEFEARMRGVAAFKAETVVPFDIPVAPFGEGRLPEKVILSTLFIDLGFFLYFH